MAERIGRSKRFARATGFIAITGASLFLPLALSGETEAGLVAAGVAISGIPAIAIERKRAIDQTNNVVSKSQENKHLLTSAEKYDPSYWLDQPAPTVASWAPSGVAHLSSIAIIFATAERPLPTEF